MHSGAIHASGEGVPESGVEMGAARPCAMRRLSLATQHGDGRVSHLLGVCIAAQIARAYPTGERVFERLKQALACLRVAQVFQHQRGGPDRPGGIGNALPGNIGRRAMTWFIHTATIFIQ